MMTNDERWEVELRDTDGCWYMESCVGTRDAVLQKYRDAGYAVLKLRPKR